MIAEKRGTEQANVRLPWLRLIVLRLMIMVGILTMFVGTLPLLRAVQLVRLGKHVPRLDVPIALAVFALGCTVTTASCRAFKKLIIAPLSDDP